MGVGENLQLERLPVSVQEVKNLLLREGYREYAFGGSDALGTGFRVSKLELGEYSGQVMVECRAKPTYRPLTPTLDRAVWDRMVMNEQMILATYQGVLSAAGLSVTKVDRSPGGSLAYLVVK